MTDITRPHGLAARLTSAGVALLLSLGLVVGLAPAVAGAASSSGGTTRYVSASATGTSGSPGTSCDNAGYRTISSALQRAGNGDTVVVCAGTYAEHVTIAKAVTLRGDGNPVIDATGFNVAVRMTGDGATVTGLTITNATGQGIFATNVDNVTIKDSVVEHNDLGVGGKSTYLYCTTKNFVPDCGEGVHLSGVSNSRVEGNTIRNNSGGILVSDELGPTHDNVITGNTVVDNILNCGVTIVGHKKGAVDTKGKLHPKVAGVYDNTFTKNVVTNNGTTGTGAGILLANPKAGMAVYRNTVSGNTVSQNGLAGITVNENTPGQYIDSNVITANTVGTNNLLKSATAGNGATTAISVFVADGARDVRVTVSDNAISANAFGIYALKGTVLTQSGNTFTDVTTPVYVGT
jgi:parallel beta-helix repeat protein